MTKQERIEEFRKFSIARNLHRLSVHRQRYVEAALRKHHLECRTQAAMMKHHYLMIEGLRNGQ
jgi:hypothetical protein